MDLLTPGSGLFFWQTIIFLVLFFMLRKFAWRPILNSLRIREESIQDALDAAKSAKEEMAQLKADNEELLREARSERDKILKDATVVANKLKDEAKDEASKITEKMIEEARESIESEKNAAIKQVKNEVASLSLEIAEIVIKKNLEGDKAQSELVSQYLKDSKFN